nr:anthrone oxygenase family protein [Streptomonospora nanhaiensis]
MVATGWFAGLFFTFQIAVMPGLARCEDRVFTAAMRAMNTAILNPLFAVAFVGSPLSLAGAALAHLAPAHRPALVWIAAAFVLVVLVVVVTMTRNVPLNDALEREGAAAADDAGHAAARRRFAGPWVRWNALRTAASALAVACLAAAMAA